MDRDRETQLKQETMMPYKSRSDLPESVRDNLPTHAQDIYKEAFNSAWDEYGHDESRAHRVAWGAVERKYHKDQSGKWVEGATEDPARR
jgi:cation transport regulator